MNRFVKLALSSALALSLCNVAMANEMGSGSSGMEKSGLFVGVNLGVSILNVALYANDKKVDLTDATSASFNAGLKVGYQQFFMPLVGVRGYLSYDFDGSRKFYNASLAFQNITLNADVLVNFLNSDSFTFGAFAGFGLGWGIVTGEYADALKSTYDYNGFNIPLNLGVAATFATNHKVELGAKIQTLAAGYTLKSDKKSGVYINPHVIYAGYSFIF